MDSELRSTSIFLLCDHAYKEKPSYLKVMYTFLRL
ncbi:hypothetical protein BVRB_3g066520 [Beta vulgaris subsp. vulgaris]|nr:hypothetical protein BVRB_3g066520 [Beta vulgaris subsp. vulgaris]